MELKADDCSDDPRELCSWTELHDLLQSMPVGQRTVVELLWYHNMGHKRAAKVLRCSVRTIKRRWQAARRRLEKFLRGD